MNFTHTCNRAPLLPIGSLVEELPQYFECYNKTFDFTVKIAVPSLISLFDEEPCYADFNAYPLFEGLQMALSGTDGCFVCFGGNTFLIGKTEDELFIFDSHARCSRGYVSFTGKSTRIMFKHVEDVFLHMKSLAISMGFTMNVECELSGVLCAVKEFSIGEGCVEEREGTLKQGFSFSSQSDIDTSEEKVEKVNYSNIDCIMSNEFEAIQTDDIIIVGEEVKQQNFIPLSTEKKRNLCKNLKLPYCDLACEEKSCEGYGQTNKLSRNSARWKLLF